MKTRAITGVFFVFIVIGSLLLGEDVFSVFWLLLATACLAEFYSLFGAGLSRSGKLVGAVMGFVALSVSMGYALGIVPVSSLTILLIIGPAIMLWQLFRQEPDPFQRIALSILGLVYVMVPFYCFHGLGFFSSGTYGYHLPLGLLLLIWANDTGAYILGRAFGRNKLFERVSPGKTWEGFAGGFLSALVVGLLLYRYIGGLPQWQWLVVAGLVSVAGTLGDLVESMLKRSLGVKDSGGILPGHGGLLDRFDSLLFAAPAVYVFLYLLN